jgi:plasmid stabilization system protein ParE
MTVRTLDAAQDDIDSTARRLERERAGFGSAFFALYQAARSAIIAAPRQHSPTEDGPVGIETREVFVERFNQRVIYAATDSEVVILAVEHAHRRPGSWTARAEQV